MRIKREDLRNTINKAIILLFFFVILFIKSQNKVSYQGAVFVKYLSGEKAVILLFVGMIGLLFALMTKFSGKENMNSISALLLLRFLFFIIINTIITTFSLVNTEFQPGIVLAYLLSFSFFNIGVSSNNKKYTAHICGFSIIIITIQLLLTYIGRNLTYTEAMKWWMVIPIGQTNAIGCYIIGMLLYFNSVIENKKNKIIISIFALIGIILTYSRSGLLMYLLFIMYIAFNDLRKNNRKGKIRIILIIIMMLCFFGMLYINNASFFDRFTINNLSGSRLKVYYEGFKLLSQHLLIGIGAYSYHIYDAYKAHNWILETLIQNGIVCSFLYFLIISKVIKKVKKISPELTVFIIFYLIHGLVEPNLYTATTDSFFWLLVGTCMYEKKKEQKELKNNE